MALRSFDIIAEHEKSRNDGFRDSQKIKNKWR